MATLIFGQKQARGIARTQLIVLYKGQQTKLFAHWRLNQVITSTLGYTSIAVSSLASLVLVTSENLTHSYNDPLRDISDHRIVSTLSVGMYRHH